MTTGDTLRWKRWRDDPEPARKRLVAWRRMETLVQRTAMKALLGDRTGPMGQGWRLFRKKV